MRLRTVTVALVAVALVIVIAAVMMGNSTGQKARLADSADAGTSQANRSPGAPSTDASGKNDKSDSPSGKEGNPSANSPVPYRLPDPEASAKPKPLVSKPLPATASARGSIVAGFPAVIPKAPKSTVAFSSVATQGTRMQVGLDATSGISPADVLSYYRTTFTRLGLVATSAPAVTGSTALVFVRGANGITVTVSDAPGTPRSHYTVTAVFRAGT